MVRSRFTLHSRGRTTLRYAVSMNNVLVTQRCHYVAEQAAATSAGPVSAAPQPLARILSSALNLIKLQPRARALPLPVVVSVLCLSVIYDFVDRECPQNLC